jgi:hypothetical protein
LAGPSQNSSMRWCCLAASMIELFVQRSQHRQAA